MIHVILAVALAVPIVRATIEHPPTIPKSGGTTSPPPVVRPTPPDSSEKDSP